MAPRSSEAPTAPPATPYAAEQPTLVGGLLPPGATYAETFGDLPEPLFPEEVAALARAVPKRRREFATVRGCARRALAGLGTARRPMVPGERGMPPWPPGILGSMTHCDGYRAAVAARTGVLRVLGVDAEPDEPLPPGVLDVVALPEERTALRELARGQPEVAWDRLLFCAKEAVYKAWFPGERRWLGFDGAHVTLEPGGSFAVELLVADTGEFLQPDSALRGRWVARDGFLVTALTALAFTRHLAVPELALVPERR